MINEFLSINIVINLEKYAKYNFNTNLFDYKLFSENIFLKYST